MGAAHPVHVVASAEGVLDRAGGGAPEGLDDDLRLPLTAAGREGTAHAAGAEDGLGGVLPLLVVA